MPAQIQWSAVQQYVEGLVPPRHPQLQRMEQEAHKLRFPIIGPACGQLCYQLARMIGAKRVFELGSGFGYSTAWFARAMSENGQGQVFHVVWDETLSTQAREHLSAMGLDPFVQFRVGEAIAALRDAEGPFDIIFNDIDKEGYPEAFPVIESKLRVGGVMIVDNLIWHGQVLDERDREASTMAIRLFTEQVVKSDRWILNLVPIRDGLLVATKIAEMARVP